MFTALIVTSIILDRQILVQTEANDRLGRNRQVPAAGQHLRSRARTGSGQPADCRTFAASRYCTDDRSQYGPAAHIFPCSSVRAHTLFARAGYIGSIYRIVFSVNHNAIQIQAYFIAIKLANDQFSLRSAPDRDAALRIHNVLRNFALVNSSAAGRASINEFIRADLQLGTRGNALGVSSHRRTKNGGCDY